MRVAHFLAHYPLPGGTTKAVGGLCQALIRQGCQVVIWTYEVLEGREPPIPVRTFQGGTLRRLVPPSSLRRAIRQERRAYDLIVLHGMFNPQISSLALALQALDIPYVVCPHGTYHPRMLARNSLLKSAYAPLERYVLNSSRGVHLFTESHVAYLRRFGVTAPTFILPNGVEAGERPALARVRRPDPADGTRLLYLGRIDASHKGVDLLLRAAAQVKRSARRAVRITLIGPDWGDRGRLEHLSAQMELSPLVHFAGPDYQRKPTEIIREHDVLVLPSRYDGFPMVVLEAMVAGTPVIVSPEAGVAEHVERARCGLVVPPDVDALAGAIAEMIAQRERWEEMGERGRRYVLTHLTWDAIAAAAVEAYTTALRRAA